MGFLFLFGDGAISWQSRCQSVVACSSTEAEYIAGANATKEALWLRLLGSELGISGSGARSSGSDARSGGGGEQQQQCIVMHADNQSAIKLLKDPISSHRTKHIDVAFHFARKHVRKGHIKFVFVPTNKQLADALTKAVGKQPLLTFLAACGLR